MSFSLSEFDSIVEKFEELVEDEYVVSKKSAYVVEFYEGEAKEKSASVEVKYMSGFDLFVVNDFRRADAETKFDSKAEVYEYLIEEL